MFFFEILLVQLKAMEIPSHKSFFIASNLDKMCALLFTSANYNCTPKFMQCINRP